LERDSGAGAIPAPDSALDALRRAHRAAARANPARVHPSWWIRALEQESPAVQRAVTALAPDPVRHAVQAGLLLDSQDLLSDRPADAEAREWVWSLWSERLLGGEPDPALDPPVIMALTSLPLHAGYRLCRMAGLAKLALAAREPDDALRLPSGPFDRARSEWLRDRLASAPQVFRRLAEADLQANPTAKWPRRFHVARLGLVTIARLLSGCEPFRVRWALQHWPYTIAKLTRSIMPPAGEPSTSLLPYESLVLKTAWDRLTLKRQLRTAWPGAEGTESGAT
jgi:hypothetical protein